MLKKESQEEFFSPIIIYVEGRTDIGLGRFLNRQLFCGPPAVAMDVFLFSTGPKYTNLRNSIERTLPRYKNNPSFLESTRLSHFSSHFPSFLIGPSRARVVCLGDVSRRYLSPRMREFTQRERRYEILRSKRNLMTPFTREANKLRPRASTSRQDAEDTSQTRFQVFEKTKKRKDK